LYPKFKDAWLELYPGRSKSESGTYPSDKPTRRLDRLFYTPETIEVANIKYIGRNKIEGATLPSDHLGVIATIRLK